MQKFAKKALLYLTLTAFCPLAQTRLQAMEQTTKTVEDALLDSRFYDAIKLLNGATRHGIEEETLLSETITNAANKTLITTRIQKLKSIRYAFAIAKSLLKNNPDSASAMQTFYKAIQNQINPETLCKHIISFGLSHRNDNSIPTILIFIRQINGDQNPLYLFFQVAEAALTGALKDDLNDWNNLGTAIAIIRAINRQGIPTEILFKSIIESTTPEYANTMWLNIQRLKGTLVH